MKPSFLQRSVALLMLLTACGSFLASGAEDAGNEKSAAAQYKALISEYEAAQDDYRKVYSAAKTDEERKAAGKKYPQPEKYAARFLDLAAKHPASPVAVDALVWVASSCSYEPPGEKAMEVLLTSHVKDAKLGPLCERLAYTSSAPAEKLLRAVLEKNPSHEVQGKACLSLARILKDRDTRQAETLFNQVIEKFSDVTSSRGTLADSAKSELFEILSLAVGKAAPEIEGEDVDGRKFKLSDYRGKVVVLDFWGDW